MFRSHFATLAQGNEAEFELDEKTMNAQTVQRAIL